MAYFLSGAPTSHSVWANVRCSCLVVGAGKTLYVQGDRATSVMFVEDGAVQLTVLSRVGRLTVLSRVGKQAVLEVLEGGSFFGEGALTGQPLRMATAITVRPSWIRIVDTQEMAKQLRSRPEFADYFLKYALARNTRSGEDLADQKLHTTEQRLARTLLLLARVDQSDHQHRVIPKVTQATLAEMVGGTRPRVNFFLNKFRKLGFIEYDGGIRVNHSLLDGVVRGESDHSMRRRSGWRGSSSGGGQSHKRGAAPSTQQSSCSANAVSMSETPK